MRLSPLTFLLVACVAACTTTPGTVPPRTSQTPEVCSPGSICHVGQSAGRLGLHTRHDSDAREDTRRDVYAG